MRIARIALLALVRERVMLLFTVVGLAAALGPLLILYGLKFGVISGLLDVLRKDPRNREIIFRGNYSLEAKSLDQLRSLAGAEFVIGAPRTISARMNFEKENSPTIAPAGVVPSGPGDPLLKGIIDRLSDDQVALSTSLARRLNIQKGDFVLASNSRRAGNTDEIFELRLNVAAILPASLFEGERALLTSPMLERLEAFLDGYAVPGVSTGFNLATRPQRFETVRFYASRLEDVATLDEAIGKLGYTIISKGAEVRAILALDRNLALVFTGLASIASIGYAISLAASLASNFEQNRRHIGLLRLCGASRIQILSWPLLQGLTIAFCGFFVSLLIYAGFSLSLNSWFADEFLKGHAICRLEPEHFGFALASSIAVVLLVVLRISFQIAGVSPSEALKQE